MSFCCKDDASVLGLFLCRSFFLPGSFCDLLSAVADLQTGRSWGAGVDSSIYTLKDSVGILRGCRYKGSLSLNSFSFSWDSRQIYERPAYFTLYFS